MKKTASVPPEGMIALVWSFLFFNLVFLTIRLYLIITRPRITKTALVSEACIGLAFILFIAGASSTTSYNATRIRYRDDKSVDPAMGMPQELVIFYFKLQLMEVEFYLACIWLVKGSFLALYFDIFRSLPSKIKRGLQITTVYTVLSWVANLLLSLLYCRPLRRVWDLERRCASFQSQLGTTFSMVTNVTTDILIMIIPILIIRTLNLRRSELLVVGFLLCMGLLTIMATLFRYTYLTKRNMYGKGGSPNFITQGQIWSYTEITVALFAACLPAGRVLLSRKKQTRRTYDDERKRTAGSETGFGRAESREEPFGEEHGEEHELVVFKSTGFVVDSKADLAGGR